MARSYLFWLILLLTGCAQIVPLTGGERDSVAPKIVAQEPVQGSTNISPNGITLDFDEYVKLQDPLTTISMSPAVGPLTSTLKKRRLTVTWNEALQPNTTYILQLNGTVRDVNEGNDSILQIVFATGNHIDSAKTSGKVIDAFRNDAISGATVGLFPAGSDPRSSTPLYATRTNAKGVYQFSYIKDQPYQLFAFLDQNKNQLVDPQETIAFSAEPISVSDSLQADLRMFQPENPQQKTRIQPLLPGLLSIAGYRVAEQQLRINGKLATEILPVSTDSILVSLPELTESFSQIIVGKDTLQRTIQPKERVKLAGIRLVSKNVLPESDTIRCVMNLLPRSIDTSKIALLNGKGERISYRSTLRGNELQLIPATNTNGSLRLRFERLALSDGITASDSCSLAVQYLGKKELATLELDASALNGIYLIEVLDGQTLVRVVQKSAEEQKISINGLVPGNYSLRCIEDRNNNGQWDSGSYPDAQAEKVLRFAIKQRLKANWVVEETLKIEP